MIDYTKLRHTRLFQTMTPEEIASILDCLHAQYREYPRGSLIFQREDILLEIGIVVKGSVHLLKEDYWGRQSLLTHIEEYGMFGEAFAALGAPLTFNVLAAKDSSILFLNVRRILKSCSSACRFHQRLIQNLFLLLAEKNLELSGKVSVLAQRSIRSKLMEYLSSQADLHHSFSFTIPFNRQQLADYLSVDRSSMTVELRKMEQEHILPFDKNRFELL